MNQFQKNIISQLPQFTANDFKYFLKESQDKVESLGLNQTCKIHTTFKDSNNPEYDRAEYCLKNCGLKCCLKHSRKT